MRSFGIPLEAIGSPAALLAAWRSYRSGKRRRPAVAHFELRAEERLLRISDAVLAERYRHGRYRLLPICDPKPRMIAVATVADRIVHRAIYDALAPPLNRSLITDTYACLPGRGSHRAVLRFLELARRFRYVLHLDIERYFPSVDHEVLMGLLAPKLRDPRVPELLRRVLDSGRELYEQPEMVDFYGTEEEGPGRPRGLPIGNLNSQWWGNLYLSGLDHFVKRDLRAAGYLRYMDDFVCFADEPATFRSWRSEIREWLWEERRLRLKLTRGHVRSTSIGHNFLGYRVTRQGLDLGAKAIGRFRRRIAEVAATGDPEQLRRSLVAWRGAVGLTSSSC